MHPSDAGAYKIVYCSRNSLRGQQGGDAEIERILLKSRDNNRRAGVSGALLFNAGCFAQVLEGARDAVERIYERIACDMRHRDITMLQAGYAGRRDFAEWSMAYAGEIPRDEMPLLARTLDMAFVAPGSNAASVLALLRRVLLSERLMA